MTCVGATFLDSLLQITGNNYTEYWTIIQLSVGQKRAALRWIPLHYSPTLSNYKLLVILFIRNSFIEYLYTLLNKSLCFCPEVNSAKISGAEQPIKLREKHYIHLPSIW